MKDTSQSIFTKWHTKGLSFFEYGNLWEQKNCTLEKHWDIDSKEKSSKKEVQKVLP